MFRKGGSVNSGIMSGMRENFQDKGMTDATSEAIAKFQRTKKGLDMDGVWGYSTGNSLTDKEKKIMKSCRSEHGDIIDKFLIWLGIG